MSNALPTNDDLAAIRLLLDLGHGCTDGDAYWLLDAVASLRDQLKSAQSELERARKDAERVTSEAGEYFAKLVLANDLLRDSRVKFASICTGAECDHDGFTYEEIASLAQQGAYAIDFHFARRDSALKEQTP